LAVHGNSIAVVELLLVHGALVDAIDSKRQTALHIAAEHGYLRIVDLLLDSNADVGAFDLKGRTPYDLAKIFERGAVMEALSKAYGECGSSNIVATQHKECKGLQILSFVRWVVGA
jgi:ankyrin repeat protein